MPISVANPPGAYSAQRYKPRPKPVDLSPLPPAPDFLRTIDPIMIAALAPLDRLAADMETRWGVGRLPSLVSPETAARFASAKRKLDLAIRAKSADTAAARATVLCRGWRVLDAEARALGHAPDDLPVWCIRHPVTEKSFAIVKHPADAGAAQQRFPDHTVLTLADLVASNLVTFRAQQLSTAPLPADEIPF
jgi:hypothetical protein